MPADLVSMGTQCVGELVGHPQELPKADPPRGGDAQLPHALHGTLDAALVVRCDHELRSMGLHVLQHDLDAPET